MTPEHSNNHLEQVKPCPLCGGKPCIDARDDNYVYCYCINSGGSVHVETWNNRIDSHGPDIAKSATTKTGPLLEAAKLESKQVSDNAQDRAIWLDGAKWAIESFGPQAAGQWIPVSDRLPTGTDDVWACHAGSKITEKMPAHYVEMSGRTHWQEIKRPTPPEQTSEGK